MMADVDVCVIGAGFAGLAAALRLKQAGRSVAYWERGAGAVWVVGAVFAGLAAALRRKKAGRSVAYWKRGTGSAGARSPNSAPTGRGSTAAAPGWGRDRTASRR